MKLRSYSWADWVAALVARRASPQSLEVSGQIDAWFFDGGEEHITRIWRGDIPISADVTQAQNDANLAEYDTRAAAREFNNAIDQKNYDGRLITQPVTLGSGQWHNWHGEGDDVTSTPQTIGGGTPFEATVTSGNVPVTWEYRDPVWIAGGYFKYQGAQMSDHVSFVIYAPATVVTPNGSSTGNCDVAYGVIVPSAGGNTGAYDVDLTTATPVPTSDFAPYSGYWNYELPADMKGRGTITPGPYVAGAPVVAGTCKYHLLAYDKPLDRFVNGERLLGDGVNYYEPQNINVSLCMPGWRFTCTVHNGNGTHTLEAVWRVLVSRYWTIE